MKHSPQLGNEPLDENGNTVLHIATELANESAVTILLAQYAPALSDLRFRTVPGIWPRRDSHARLIFPQQR